jgi:hypothetical protein
VDTHVDGHDYYMLFLHTPDRAFAAGMRRAGIPATVVREMSFVADQTSGFHAHERVRGEGAYDLIGTPLPGFPNAQDFMIRGWRDSGAGLSRHDEHRTGAHGVYFNQVLHADRGTLLGRLMNGTERQAFDLVVTYGTAGHVWAD